MALPLEIKNLTKKYGSFTAVDDIFFSIGEGEIFGLLGPNGAGKNSIISTTTGITVVITTAKLLAGNVSNPSSIEQKSRSLPESLWE